MSILPGNLISLKQLRVLSSSLERLLDNHIGVKILLALVLGSGLGILLGPSMGLVPKEIATGFVGWLVFPGKLFIALVQMVVIPLVFVSVVGGIAGSESVAQLQKLGVRIGIYFLLTTTLAVVVGLSVALFMAPGKIMPKDKLLALSAAESSSIKSLNATSRESTGQGEPSSLEGKASAVELVGKGLVSAPQVVLKLLPQNPLYAMVSGEMLQIIFFAMVVGAALLTMASNQALPLLQLMAGLQEICMTVVRWAMRLAPYAVFGLSTQMVSQVGAEILRAMLYYVVTVLTGLAILLFIYGLAVTLLAKKNGILFFRDIRDVLVLAFSTSSSAAVMPLTMRTAQEKLSVRPQIAQFLVPLGATINMDGTAMYQGVATVFLAQAYGLDLSVSDMLLVVVTAVGASIGSPGTPGVAMVILTSLLTSLGIPASGIALLLAVDRLLDMCRTMVNVSGDLTAAVILNRWIK